ncbi:tyrosine-type recombinase/integrase [Laribacter hongkongensis]|uniref:Tyrosine-type recombinase/integrase n=1 Tax=Laribacter hongkongensis TaxID=168471 RepID=A0ABD4SRR6_9NEIS|nr:site-specific integrase [Laribacter hongkongensis]MCG9025697.1 tyrosine-type recombinase/integrase [Laribacter hongkongensis]MCG9101250.1 tyrosine-type recombinase/integrase [Laribacter hongkongensis]MCG9103731.1 tyrosine-type recombinase/integrase [Laribacter hongkongensis]MCG9112836.1 tyrosine-type recombinase/integrase [Laribacter hongkongensis]MCG9118891.1 tyrosine-type recombinase/integrase [Laribacter hongkongensis]
MEMARIAHTYKHPNGVYYFNLKTPKALSGHFPTQLIRFSLNTKDPRKAAVLAAQHFLRYQAEFDSIRASLAKKTLDVLSDDDLSRIPQGFASHLLEQDEKLRVDVLGQLEGEATDVAFETWGMAIEVFARRYRQGLAKGRVDVIEPDLTHYLASNGIAVSKDAPEYRKLLLAALKAAIRAFDEKARRHQGEVVETPAMPSLQPVKANTGKASGDGLMELLDKYQAERKLPLKTFEDYQHKLRTFIEVNGDLPVRAIEKKHGIAFKDALVTKGLSAKTINEKYLAMVKAVLNWASTNDYVELNLLTPVRVSEGKVKEEKRKPYSLKALQTIFSSPIYTRGERPEDPDSGGEAAFWLPLLALYTGARLGELAQLMVKDIQHAGGRYFLSITDEGEDRSIKTNESRRRVPVHADLIRMGLIEYVASLNPNGYLFPLLKTDKYGKRSSEWSKWWGEWCRGTLRITDKRMVFHSFRHGFKDICRACSIEEAVHDALTGHSNGSVGRSYGSGLYPLNPLFDAMDKLKVDGLDLSGIQWVAVTCSV